LLRTGAQASAIPFHGVNRLKFGSSVPPTNPAMLRRRQFCSALLSTAALAGSPAAWAQAEPPVHLLVGFPAGGGSDAIARLLAEKLQAELGRTVLVDNRPGAGGQIAAQQLKAARADGFHAVPVARLLIHQHN
jgi:tripartite-type tricarboxylate transporter receptor subunit TctC